MANNGAVSATLNMSTTSYTVPAGYHNGSGKVTQGITNKGAITGSVAIGGTYSSTQNGYVTTISVTGPSLSTLSPAASAAEIKSGYKAYNSSGTAMTGTYSPTSTIQMTKAE